MSDLSAEDIYASLKALRSESEEQRAAAIRAIAYCRDGRVVLPLISLLRDRQETPSIRGQAAEQLGIAGKRKAIGSLIECSADDSAEVRFWCVFALGHFLSPIHRPPIRVVRALEARLEDSGMVPGYWVVGLEALAMLARIGTRHTVRDRFTETLLRAFQDPLKNPDLWQWAAYYFDAARRPSDSVINAHFDSAIQTVHKAGFDPSHYGRQT
jgi:hypothetical protein